jgi:hypothetical protein
MAKLLRVHTGRFSILPKPLAGGKLQLGYVETSGTDFGRDALIGFAPLLVGTTTIAYIAFFQLEILSILNPIGKISLESSWVIISQMYSQPDFWLWLYLILVISSTMFPSSTDRRSWFPIIVLILGIIIVGVLFGVGPWILQNAGTGINFFILGLTYVFGISTFIHFLLLVPLWGMRCFLVQVTGMKLG